MVLYCGQVCAHRLLNEKGGQPAKTKTDELTDETSFRRSTDRATK